MAGLVDKMAYVRKTGRLFHAQLSGFVVVDRVRNFRGSGLARYATC